MLLVDRPEIVNQHKELLLSFQCIYEEAFPDSNEREDFKDILDRVQLDNLQLRTLIGIHREGEKAISGIIIDIYDECIFHLIYLVVAPQHRNQGWAKRLIQEDIKRLILDINPKSAGVFLESNIPWKTEKDAFDPKIRLHIFKNLGIKLIPIEYTQPPLSAGKDKVNNLFLLYLPLKEESTIELQLIQSFLNLFFKGLGCQTENNRELDAMNGQLLLLKNQNNQIEMKEIPTLEDAKFKFGRASIGLQFSSKQQNLKHDAPCDHFFSYETDLLSFHFQRDRPFTSRYLDELSLDTIEIHFPESYCFNSEGRSYDLINQRKTIVSSLNISKTDFHQSNNAVWTMVFVNKEGDYFSELEIIKLSSYFGSTQERTGLKEQIRFAKPGNEPLPLEKFIKQQLGFEDQHITLGSGILQIDTAHIECSMDGFDMDWDGFYQNMNDSLNPQNNSVELNNQYEEDSNYETILNLLCGFSLGIFDYNRMGFDEVIDTLTLLKGDNGYLLFVNRGIMLNLCHEDEMFESVVENIGISPYLLIPNSVLNNNTYYLESTLNALKAIDL